jgi:hypothetical protein
MKIISQLTPQQVKDLGDNAVKLLPGLSDAEVKPILSNKIRKSRESEKMIHFETVIPVKQPGYTEYQHTRYWYRTMKREDFLSLAKKNQVATDREKDYGGIAPNFEYAKKYFGNEKDGTHIVEFAFEITGGEFYERINEQEKSMQGNKFRAQTPKAEGGGTIGLGPKGMYGGTAGKVFNEMLDRHEINWRLVYFGIPK